ncbi:DNA-binding response regulator [Neiella marina]|uniref:DNA-binding response regulator n=1 Tax=Neiella marina TaxID=508461 RepID=A0A8J2U977_9GAMM|nr:DNA-binding response regulator [Neiella marina]
MVDEGLTLKILLIEDNTTIASQIIEFLSSHQCQVDYAANGKLGIELALNQIFDVILLDLNLPDIDGLQVCQAIKSQASVNPPILMLTARDSFDDKSAGFHQGADDYLTKPVDLRELVLRCQALARRNTLHQSQVIELGPLELDITSQTARRDGQSLTLTSVGFQLLTLLAQSHPQPVARSLIMHKIWGDSPPDSDALKSHIYSLRQALDKPFAYPMLKTVMNLGYRLELPQ